MATAEADIQNKVRKDKESSRDIEDSKNYQEFLPINVADEREDIKAEQIKLSSEEDLESLLKLAEELREKIDKGEKNFNISIFRTCQIIYIFAPIFFYLFLSSHYTNIIILTSVIVVFICEYQIRNIKSRCLPDKLALKEVLQLLREVHGTIAEREDWSILKRAEFRIRLSRFDLSEKKASVFNFFS